MGTVAFFMTPLLPLPSHLPLQFNVTADAIVYFSILRFLLRWVKNVTFKSKGIFRKWRYRAVRWRWWEEFDRNILILFFKEKKTNLLNLCQKIVLRVRTMSDIASPGRLVPEPWSVEPNNAYGCRSRLEIARNAVFRN